MYLGGHWYGLGWDGDATPAVQPSLGASGTEDDPVGSLDVTYLQEHLLEPLLAIGNYSAEPRIDFVGGIRGTQALEQRVSSGAAAVAFSMYPVTAEQIMAVADAGKIMPPKSTWFEPKLRSGLFVHTF